MSDGKLRQNEPKSVEGEACKYPLPKEKQNLIVEHNIWKRNGILYSKTSKKIR